MYFFCCLILKKYTFLVFFTYFLVNTACDAQFGHLVFAMIPRDYHFVVHFPSETNQANFEVVPPPTPKSQHGDLLLIMNACLIA